MIGLEYKIDLKKDGKSLESFSSTNVTKAEVSNLIHFLEKVKLDLLSLEFEVGEGGYEILED